MARNLVLASMESMFDGNGFPVNGTLTAYVKGTQDLADIWDTDGVVLANPLTVCQGRVTPFVTEDSLTLVLKDSNESVVRTEHWIYPTIGVTTEGSEIPAYDTYADLVASNATGAVYLMGYNEIGDKPAKIYIGLTERTTETPDGGYIIRGDNHDYVMGTNEIDTRDYGMFGEASAVDAHASYNASKWANMVAKSNLFGTRLHVSSGYYELPPSLNMKVSGSGTLCPNNTSLIVDVGSSAVSFAPYYNGSALADGTVQELVAETFKTSNTSIPVGKYKVNHLTVDTNVNVTLSGGVVSFEVTHTKDRYLTACTIESASKLSTESGSSESLTECEINEGAFVSGYNFDGTYRNCPVGVFTDAHNYLKVCSSNGAFADMDNKTLSTATSLSVRPNMVILNGTIDADVSVPYGVSDASIVLVNTTITDNADFTNYATVFLVNCSASSTWLAAHNSQVFNVGERMEITSLLASVIAGAKINGTTYVTSTHEMSKSKGTLYDSSVPTKYHFLPTEYLDSSETPTGYGETLTVNNSDNTVSITVCVGYWTNGGVNYRAYLTVPAHTVKHLHKVTAYTTTAIEPEHSQTVNATCYFTEDSGELANLAGTLETYHESY